MTAYSGSEFSIEIQYEDELPENITDHQYELWYQYSFVSDGVRVGFLLDRVLSWHNAKNLGIYGSYFAPFKTLN